MLYIFILNCVVLGVGIIMGLLRCRTSKKFVRANLDTEIFAGGYECVVIIVPICNEQDIIEQSFLNFLPLMKQGVKVVFVGTKKEKGEIKTYDILEQIVNRYEMKNYCEVLVYPSDNGVMAHQLNYALNQIGDDMIVGIYNVDSVININTINYVLQNQNLLKQGVFQQYSYSEYQGKGMIIDGIKWQNRWSLAYELPRTIKPSEFGIQKFNYVIGHGLYFKKEILNKIGLFSEEQINEDNVLGYELACNNIKIYPIPFMEKIDFAINLRVYVKQQAVWFNGPLYAFNYLLDKGKKQRIKWDYFIMACKNFKNALNWFAIEIVTMVLLIYLTITRKYVLMLILLLETVMYVVIPNWMSERILTDMRYLEKRKCKNVVLFMQ